MTQQILNSKIRYLFVDNSNFQVYDNLVTEHNPKVLESAQGDFVKRTPLGFLDVYERLTPRQQHEK